jgi:hypothetical protein
MNKQATFMLLPSHDELVSLKLSRMILWFQIDMITLQILNQRSKETLRSDAPTIQIPSRLRVLVKETTLPVA